MSEKIILDEANQFVRKQARRTKRIIKLKEWLANNPSQVASFERKYAQLTQIRKSNFWLLLRRMNVDKALNQVTRLQTVIKQAKSKRGLHFRTKNGALCIFKRLDKTRYAPLLLEYEKKWACDHKVPLTNAWKAFFADPKYFRYYILVYKKGNVEYGLIYWLATTEERVSTSLLTIVDAALNERPRHSTFLYDFAFYNNTIYDKDASTAKIIVEAVRRKITPTMAALITSSKR